MHTLWLLIKILFWTIIIFSFLNAFLTHFILWVHLRLLSLQDENKTPLPLIMLIKSFFIEFFCILTSAFLYSFKSWTIHSKPPLLDVSAPPILLVHGYCHHQHAWVWFIQQLRKKEGIGPIYTINLHPSFTSIRTFATEVQDKVNAIQAETGAEQVILIGHSMGGLVNSYFCEYLAKPNQVAKVITLGSPFKGTIAAALTAGENGQEMSPHSSFSAKLLEKIQQSSVPYFSIASKLDNMVIPWQSAIIQDEETTKAIIFKDYGHLRLLISPSVIEQVSKWIKHETVN